MAMKHTILFLLLSQFAMAFAQDYLPIRQGRTYFFGLNNIVQIDSVLETVPGYEIQYAAPGVTLCLETGLDLGHFSFRDSLFLHKKQEAEFWVIPPSIQPYQIPYQLDSGATAFCTTIDEINIHWASEGVQLATFLTETDSVRTLRLICRDSNGTVLPNHYLHNQRLRLSQHHGALNWLALSEVFAVTDSTPQAEIFDLSGISNPDIGFPGYSRKDIYDFYPGDEVHHKEETRGYGFHTANYTRWICTDRDTLFNENLIRIIREFTNQRISWDYSGIDEPYWQPIFQRKDTIEIQLHSVPYLPHQIRYDSYWWESMDHYSTYTGTPQLLGIKSISMWEEQSSWCESIITDVLEKRFCFPGLGCYYFDWSGNSFSDFDGIVYYHKVDSTWGTPLPDSIFSNAVSVSDPLSRKSVSVFPNPGASIISLRGVANHATIEIFDLTSKQVWRGTYDPQGIDLSELSAGMYHIRLPELNVSLKWRKE